MRRRPAGRPPPPTQHADIGALRCIGGAVRRRYEQELADTGATDHDGTILEATDAARRRPDLLTTPKRPRPVGEGATLIGGRR